MSVPASRMLGGKKMMWDGKLYDSEHGAREVAQGYAADGFEVEVVEHEGRYAVYSRRVVKEVTVEGQQSD